MSKLVAGHMTKMWFLKIMNYLFLNAHFALKLQGKCWEVDVGMFTAYLSVAIKRLTRLKQKVVLPSNMVANTINDTTCWKIKVP